MLTYAGNLGNLASLAGDARHVFVRGDIGDRALVAALLARAPAARDRQLRRRDARRPLDPRPGGVHRDQRRRHVRAARGDARVVDDAARRPSATAFRFLHVSTDEVYGSLRPTDPAFSETTPYAPNSPYSASKAASDHLVRAYHHTYGLPTLTTNCSNNYGPRQFPEKLIPLMIVNALAGKPLPVYGDGRNVRDWLYVGDHCAAIRAVLAARPPGRDLQHRRQRGDAEPRRRAHALRAAGRGAARAATTRALITFVKDRPGHDRRYAIDAAQDRARDSAGRRRRRSRPGMRRTVRWYLDNARLAAHGVTSKDYQKWINSATTRRLDDDDDAQRHHPRRRLRHAALPGDAGRVEAAAAGVRQADDLLPAVDADAGRHPRHPADLDAGGHAALRAAAGRRRALGPRHPLRGAAVAGRPRAGVHHRPRLRRPRRVARWCSATTSSTATTCSRSSQRARARATGATVFAYPVADPERYGVAEFDARRARAVARGKADGAEVALRGDRPLFLRQPRASTSRAT